MFNSIPLLSVLALLPLVGALVVALLKGHTARLVGFGLAVTTAILGIALVVLRSTHSFVEDATWIAPIGAHYALTLEPMNAILVLLTVLLVPVVMLAEWNVGEREGSRWSTGAFFALVLALESFSLYVFMAGDLLLFYIAFEATLIPMYFLIGGWGGVRRQAAALKFLLYSLLGGLVMLVGVVGLYAVSVKQSDAPSLLFSDLAELGLNDATGKWLFAAFFFAFAVKAPLAGLHTWLPDATEQARSGSSTLLVSILDKIGTFGMIKVCLMIFPEASAWATPVILVWAIVSVIYGALMALGSKDLLRFVGYTSVSHFGFMVFGIFAVTTSSLSGAIFYMLAHGLSTAALFLVVGYLADRRGTAQIGAFGGAQRTVPVLAGFLLMSGLSTLALPGMASFVGEFLTMAGAWQRHPIHTAVITLGTVLAAVYVTTMYLRTMTGPVTDQVAEHVTRDLDWRERAAVIPLLLLLLVFGFFPKPIMVLADQAAQVAMSAAGQTDPVTPLQEGN